MKEFSSGQSQFDVRKPEYLESDYFKDPASFKQIADFLERYLKQKKTFFCALSRFNGGDWTHWAKHAEIIS